MPAWLHFSGRYRSLKKSRDSNLLNMTPMKEKIGTCFFVSLFFSHVSNWMIFLFSNYGFLFAVNKIRLLLKYSIHFIVI